MNRPRSILAIDSVPARHHGPGLVTRDVHWSPAAPDLDPFLAVSLYDMRGPTFPPHPHAGFMVATYIVPESPLGFANQDSLGTRNRIPPGALHVTVAGRGVLHEEQPEAAGAMARGFQIWIDLPDAERETEPRALHLAADHVPRVALTGGELRVVLGATAGVRSPLNLPATVTLVDAALGPRGTWTHRIDAADNAFVFVMDGVLSLDGQESGPGSLVRTRADGDALVFAAGPSGARFTLFAGTPLRQPRVVHGPFVARDAGQLARFLGDHAAGRFGTLSPMGRG
jgi:redox-sensitive bicupin YhaK (pirin superfamily)